MIKDVLNHLQYSMLADTALVLFAGVFLAVCVRTFWLKKEDMNHHANMALFDRPEDLNREP